MHRRRRSPFGQVSPDAATGHRPPGGTTVGNAVPDLYSVDVSSPGKATRRRAASLFAPFLLAIGTLLAQGPAGPPLNAPILPLDQVHRGQHGTAWTVFEGTAPEAMEVEILGVLKDNLGPGQDMILARLHGPKPEFTGVVAGMSGSPVYIDGKLIGALAFRIGQFSREPICGITPIELMFQVRDLPARTPPEATQPGQTTAALPASIEPAQLPAASVTSSAGQLQPIATPLAFSGFSTDTISRFGDGFRSLGLEPVAGLGSAAPAPSTASPTVGSAIAAPMPSGPIVPGSAVSAILARGDLNIAGTCTVTYVDAKQLLACGHPITQYGDIDIPMTKAEVLATLPSPMNAFKIVNTTETIGAFTQDRANAIAGTFGGVAPMIPVTVALLPAAGSGLPARTLHFEVLNNRELTPQVMLAGLFQALTGTNTTGNDISLHLHGDIGVAGYPSIRIDETHTSGDAGNAAAQSAIGIAGRFVRVYSNALQQPVITGVNLRAEVVPARQSMQIESARLSTEDADPGDTVTVEATLRPFQAPVRIVRIPVTLPTTLESGPLRILVSEAATLDRLLSPPAAAAARPLDLADTVAQLNRTHSNDRIYVTLLDHETQAVTAAATLPALPPSMVNALQPLRDTRDISFTSETAREAGSVALDAAVSGSQVLTLRIR